MSKPEFEPPNARSGETRAQRGGPAGDPADQTSQLQTPNLGPVARFAARIGAGVGRLMGLRAKADAPGAPADQRDPGLILVLTPTGRTGTTLLMSHLDQSPQVVIHNHYPYEYRMLQEEILGSSDGGGPAGYGAPAPARVFYSSLAQAQNKRAKYFAEKFLGLDLQPLAGGGADIRFLATIRDPRDILLSIRAFDQQRGFNGFALQPEDRDIDAIEKIAVAIELLIAVMAQFPVYLVRYEALVSAPDATLVPLSHWLGVEPIAGRGAIQHEWHRTISRAEDSVGRWRTEMGEPLRRLCDNRWQAILAHFGYPPGV